MLKPSTVWPRAADMFRAENLEIMLSVVLFIRTMVFSWPVDLFRKTSGARLCFQLVVGPHVLFHLERLQVTVNGAWGEDWGFGSRGKMLCFIFPFCMTGRPFFSGELEKHYTEISSLQSTLSSPVHSKIGPDVFLLLSNVKRTWSFLGWRTLNSYAAFVWAHNFQSNKRVLLIDWAGKVHKCYIQVPFYCTATLKFPLHSRKWIDRMHLQKLELNINKRIELKDPVYF